MEELLSVKQAAERKGVTVSAVYKAIHDGRLPYTSVGAGFALKPDDVDQTDFGSYGGKKRVHKPRGGNKEGADKQA